MNHIETIIRIFSEIFEIPKEQINIETQRKDISGWDSVGHLALITSIEDELDITIPQQQWKNLDSISKIVELVDTIA